MNQNDVIRGAATLYDMQKKNVSNHQIMSVSVSEENKRNTFFQNIMTIFTLSCEALWKTANPRPFIKVTTKAGTWTHPYLRERLLLLQWFVSYCL